MLKTLLFLVVLISFQSVSALNYASKSAWLIAEKNKQNTEFDVFYVHPTLLRDAAKPYPDFSNAKVRARLKGFSAAQAGIFGNSARIFVPAVRQLEVGRCLAGDLKTNPLLQQGIDDTVAAFNYYIKHFNPGGRRPYILMGHSQGAIDLYGLLKKAPEISPARGFVAAYLAGLPKVTVKQIESDLGNKGIFPARDEGSTGVVIVWNTQLEGAKNPFFTAPGAYGINPVNWRTDSLKSEKKQHKGMVLFNHRKLSPVAFMTRDGKAPVCTAKLSDNGGLIVEDVPEIALKLYSGFGKGVLHAADIWLFAGNIVENARLRVRLYQQKKALERAKMLIRTGKAECVLVKNGKITHIERGRGVSPLLRLYDRNPDAMRGGIIVDKVIGRAAAAIAISGGAAFVHGELMSEDAQRYLKEYNIASSHVLMVHRILNRKRDGLCPLEQSVSGISNPQQAMSAMRKQIARMMKNAPKQ